MKDFVNRDIEAKIIELCKKRENGIEKVENIVATSEASVEGITRRMQKAQLEIKEEKDVSFDLLSTNERKVRLFKLLPLSWRETERA